MALCRRILFVIKAQTYAEYLPELFYSCLQLPFNCRHRVVIVGGGVKMMDLQMSRGDGERERETVK